MSFLQDEHGDWIAVFQCGHRCHVRHNPPWLNRPWVTSPEGRAQFIGAALECAQCNPAQENRALVVFVAIAFALSAALSLSIGLTGGSGSRWIGLGYASMLIPALSVFATKALLRDRRAVAGLESFPLRYLPLALFLMPLVMHAAMLPTAALLNRLHWREPSVTAGRGPIRIAFGAIVGMSVVSILAFFEEIGWRGWLLPRLASLTTARRAVVLTSAIWAAWHIPYVLAGILRLDGVPLAPTTLVLPLGIFGSGLIIGWLWLRTKSLWVVSIAHGALNNWGQYAFRFTSGDGQPVDAIVLASGAAALIAVGALLLTCTRTLRSS